MSSEFWKHIPLQSMSAEQWESLCDGCGKCCLHKLEDEDTGELLFTSLSCKLLDTQSCRCQGYEKRFDLVPECVDVLAHDLSDLVYMPSTCAYRLVFEGKDLAAWHPLVSGSKNSVHHAHMSVRDRAICETSVPEDDWDLYVIDNL